MTLTDNPRLEQRLQAKLESGGYLSLEHFLVDVLDRLDAEAMPEHEWLAKIREGDAALDAGEFLTREELLADIARERALERG